MRRTPTRPPLLASDIARNNLRDPAALETIGLFSSLNRLAGIWEGLDAVRHAADPLLTPEARARLAAFDAARRGPLLARLQKLRQSGVYRQTFGGQVSLWAAAVLGKL